MMHREFPLKKCADIDDFGPAEGVGRSGDYGHLHPGKPNSGRGAAIR